jgi:hypothetical protein
MTSTEIIAKVKALHLPEGSYVVYGSAPMTLVNLREAADIDFLVTPELYQQLRAKDWQILKKGPKDSPVVKDVFEAHPNWNFSAFSPSLEELLSRATMVDGVPFASLADVRKWKVASGRPKDLADITLIDNFAP